MSGTMLSNPSVLPNVWFDLLAAMLVLGISGLAGAALAWSGLHGEDRFERLVSMLVTGMLVSIGVGVTLVFGRAGQHTVAPLAILAASLYAWRRLPRERSTLPGIPVWQAALAVVLVLGASAGFHAWHAYWLDAKGAVKMGHGDLGYYSMLARGLPEAGHSDGWAAVMGRALEEAGMARDTWYHWGPVWLGMLIHRATDLPAIESVLNATPTVLVTLMVLLSAAIVRRLTRWGLPWSLLAGAAAVVLLPFPYHLREVLPDDLPHGWSQHWRDSLVWQFPYQFEAVITLMIFLAWLRGQQLLALLMVMCATISSPHFVGGAGVAAGTLMVFGLILRDKSLTRPAAVAVGTILLTWALLHWGVGARMSSGLVTQEGKGLFGFTFQALMERGLGALTDTGIELAMCLILIPGWLAFLRRDSGLPPQARLLGWLALAALCGGMAAHHLFDHAEKFHFTDFPMTVLAMPIAGWGLALWAARLQGWRRLLPAAALAVGFATGVEDIVLRKNFLREKGLPLQVLNDLKQTLSGETYGYFARRDRPWWIPKNSFTAALLDTRCVRLNALADADVQDNAARFYGTYLIMELEPYVDGEPMHEWSLRVARKLGVRHFLETAADPVPEEIKQRCSPVYSAEKVVLHRLRETSDKVPQR